MPATVLPQKEFCLYIRVNKTKTNFEGFSGGITDKDKQKGNHLHHAISTCNSMGKILKNVHPWIKNCSQEGKSLRLPSVVKLKHFLEAWKILTKDPELLELIESYKIPFLNSNMLITLDST